MGQVIAARKGQSELIRQIRSNGVANRVPGGDISKAKPSIDFLLHMKRIHARVEYAVDPRVWTDGRCALADESAVVWPAAERSSEISAYAAPGDIVAVVNLVFISLLIDSFGAVSWRGLLRPALLVLHSHHLCWGRG